MEGDELYEELLDLQELAQKEAASIRNLLQQLKPIDVDPEHVVDFLSGMVERYRYETGISAAFVCDVPDLKLPPSICREVTRIVQEALTNVLKHSGAEDVVVRLGSESGLWTLIIEDNGRGFAFAGRLDTAALEKSRRGPLVIKDRVRAMGAELFIDSRPGQGARLEIRFPKSLQGANVR
jgi:signal transduction histidine kinase